VFGGDVALPARPGLLLRRDERAAGAPGEPAEDRTIRLRAEPLAEILAKPHAEILAEPLAESVAEPFAKILAEAAVRLCHETLLGGLFGHAHTAADLGPGGARPPRLVHEVTDEVVAHLAEVVRDEDRVREVVERAAVGVLVGDEVDEVVEAGGHPVHASTIG
jgi:hypothetical protein